MASLLTRAIFRLHLQLREGLGTRGQDLFVVTNGNVGAVDNLRAHRAVRQEQAGAEGGV